MTATRNRNEYCPAIHPRNRDWDLVIIRKRVRGIGAVKGSWRLTIAELREHARRLLADRQDWLTPEDKMVLARFVAEED